MDGADADWRVVRPNEISGYPFTNRAGFDWRVSFECTGAFNLGEFYLCY